LVEITPHVQGRSLGPTTIVGGTARKMSLSQ
jgi:hypothetical protein